MKITIEPTTGDVPNQHGVTITTAHDEHNLTSMLELLECALRAYGFWFDGQLEICPNKTSACDPAP
jgi:hypothetical protein